MTIFSFFLRVFGSCIVVIAISFAYLSAYADDKNPYNKEPLCVRVVLVMFFLSICVDILSIIGLIWSA